MIETCIVFKKCFYKIKNYLFSLYLAILLKNNTKSIITNTYIFYYSPINNKKGEEKLYLISKWDKEKLTFQLSVKKDIRIFQKWSE